MDLTNETYTIVFHIAAADGTERTERYYKDKRNAHDTKCSRNTHRQAVSMKTSRNTRTKHRRGTN